MSFYDAIRVGASGAVDSTFTVDRSLRFNSGDSPYLAYTPSGAGSNQMTFSFWMKRGAIGTQQVIFSSGAVNARGHIYIYNDKLTIQPFNSSGANGYIETNRVFRDPSAWYHIVVTLNNAAYSNMASTINVYVNNVAATFTTHVSGTPTGGNRLNDAQAKRIGEFAPDSGSHFDGYLAEFNFIDGQALTPSSFAETNSETGQWNPIDTSELNFGTNGYRLNFSDNSGTTATTLGKDSSGNGNNFTPNNFSVAAGAGNDSLEDTPTNNFPTLNPLNINPYSSSGYPSPTFSNGNLTFSTNQNNAVNYAESSFYFPSTGKWYLEVAINNINIGSGLGYLQALTIRSATSGSYYLWWVYSSPYYQINTDSGLVTISAPSNGQVLQLAFDADTGKTWFGNNNTWYLSGDPANGTAMSSPITVIGDDVRFSVSGRSGSAANIVDVNFGQRAFSYTPPTGFQALCSANLPDPTILLPNKHFDTKLINGTGSQQTITGYNFSPSWVWGKQRSATNSHEIYDVVRGVKQIIYSDLTDAEGTNNNGISAFTSDGFTIAGNTSLNQSGNTAVAWAWNAGDTDGKTYTVKVVSDGGNKYRFDDFGTSAVTLDLAEGGTYIFDGADSSMASHPIKLSETSNGTHGGGSSYNTGVTYLLDGASVTESAYVSGYSSATTRQLKIVVAASAPTLYYYCHYHSGMGGQANTNTTLGSSNFDGSRQATTKVNATAGFSIVTSTSGGSSSGSYDSFGHGLGVAPNVIILKNRDIADRWYVFNSNLSSANNKRLALNESTAENTTSNLWGTSLPSSTTFSIDQGGYSSGTGQKIVAYCLSEVAGYSKFGKYTGNGSSDNTFVFTGFRPAWVMAKEFTGTGGNWFILDNKRSSFNVLNDILDANLSNAERNNNEFDFLSNGFKVRLAYGSSQSFLYLAFAEAPFRNARAR